MWSEYLIPDLILLDTGSCLLPDHILSSELRFWCQGGLSLCSQIRSTSRSRVRTNQLELVFTDLKVKWVAPRREYIDMNVHHITAPGTWVPPDITYSSTIITSGSKLSLKKVPGILLISWDLWLSILLFMAQEVSRHLFVATVVHSIGESEREAPGQEQAVLQIVFFAGLGTGRPQYL